MKIYESVYKDNSLSQREYSAEFDKSDYVEANLINIYPDEEYGKFYGFGGAVTEASAYSYSLLDDADKAKLIEAYYGESGLGYNYARLSIDSCDFCLSNYCSKESEDGEFSLARDEKYILPFMRDIEKITKLQYMMSPWSPPAYMKSTGERNKGGKLLKEYYQACAEHYCTYIEKYLEMGFDIKCMSVQNEPLAVQTWDSCVYTTEEEGEFLSKYLFPEMKKRGLEDIKRLVWDHNRERLFERLRDIVKQVGDIPCVDGVAYHWYSGDHFEQIKMVSEKYPYMLSVFSEGCVEYSVFGKDQDTVHAEKYAYNILSCLKNGCNLFLDWNILLDSKGGPNHVGNFCAAPIMLDDNNSFYCKVSYYMIGHFSRFIKAGAKRVATSSFTDAIDHVAFKNTNGEVVVVLLNRRNIDIPFKLRRGDKYSNITIKGKSIVTITL